MESPVRVRHVRDDEQMMEKRGKKPEREDEGSERQLFTDKQTHGSVCRALGGGQERRLLTRCCCVSQPEQSNRDTWTRELQSFASHWFHLQAEIFI